MREMLRNLFPVGGNDAGGLGGGIDALGAGSGGLAPDVHDVRTGAVKGNAMVDGSFHIGIPAPVREGVGGDVENPHHDRVISAADFDTTFPYLRTPLPGDSTT